MRSFVDFCRTVWLTLNLSILVIPAVASDTLDTSPEAALSIGVLAAIYGTSPFEVHRDRSLMQLPVNAFEHSKDVFPAGFDACCPNQETLYTSGWLNLEKEPLVVELPAIPDRFYNLQLMDIYGGTPVSIGFRQNGGKAGKYLLAGPGWSGDIPAGLEHTRYPYNEIDVIGRILKRNDADLERVHEYQAGIKVTPLSVWIGSPESPPVVAYDSIDVSNPLEVYKWLGDALRRNPVPEGEEHFVYMFSKIAITQESGFEPERLTQEARNALVAAAKIAARLIDEQYESIGRDINGWKMAPTADDLARDFYTRAVVNKHFIGVQDAREATYMNLYVDEHGKQLNGSNEYELSFTGGIPVDAFFSLIAYSFPGSRLIENKFGKYTVNSTTGELRAEEDGTITIRLQARKPESNEVNWLPVPDGNFYATLRLYYPRDEILNGSYPMPSAKRVN